MQVHRVFASISWQVHVLFCHHTISQIQCVSVWSYSMSTPPFVQHTVYRPGIPAFLHLHNWQNSVNWVGFLLFALDFSFTFVSNVKPLFFVAFSLTKFWHSWNASFEVVLWFVCCCLLLWLVVVDVIVVCVNVGVDEASVSWSVDARLNDGCDCSNGGGCGGDCGDASSCDWLLKFLASLTLTHQFLNSHQWNHMWRPMWNSTRMESDSCVVMTLVDMSPVAMIPEFSSQMKWQCCKISNASKI